MKIEGLLTLAAVGVGGYFLYNFFSTPAAAAATAPAPGTPAPPTTAPATGTATITPPAAVPAGGPPAIGTSSAAGSSALVSGMKALAAADGIGLTDDLDHWSYYAQHSTGLVISPELMGKIIAAAGGDRSRQVTAEQFVQLYNYAYGSISGLAGVAPYQCDGVAGYRRPGAAYLSDGVGMGLGAVVARAYGGRR